MEEIKKYGAVGIATHLSLSLGFYATFFLILHRTNNATKLLKFFKLENKVPANAGNAVIAYVIYKGTMPIRLGVSAAVIPLVIKFGFPDKITQLKIDELSSGNDNDKDNDNDK